MDLNSVAGSFFIYYSFYKKEQSVSLGRIPQVYLHYQFQVASRTQPNIIESYLLVQRLILAELVALNIEFWWCDVPTQNDSFRLNVHSHGNMGATFM